MKIEEAKALFLAQYLGQKVMITALGSVIKLTPHSLYDVVKYDTERWCYLSLRSVDQLTDGECLIIASLFDLSDEQIKDTDLREWIEALFNEAAGYYIDGYTGNQIWRLYTC